MRFSRPTLTAIMLSSMLLIVIINLRYQHQEDMPLEPMTLPPLPQQPWHSWRSQEAVHIWHSMTAATEGQLLLLQQDGSRQAFTLAAQDWAQQLQQLPQTSQPQPASIVLRGPWSRQAAEAISAFVIDRLQLLPLNNGGTDLLLCLSEQLPGALWIAQQQGKDWSQLATIEPLQQARWPDRQQWQQWRQLQAKRLRQQWLSDSGQIDIRLHLAYHRWPDSTYSQLYLALATSQRQAPEQAQQCLLSTPTSRPRSD